MTPSRVLAVVLVLAGLAAAGVLALGRPGGGDVEGRVDAPAAEQQQGDDGRGRGEEAPVDAQLAAVGIAAPSGDLPALTDADRLRVRGASASRRLVTSRPEQVFLRGASVNALVDYGTTHTAPVAVRGSDFDQMAALGFNVTRLAVSWSKVMPEPGRLDRSYLRRITTLVRQAGRRHVYTVVSMHSDRYAADLGSGTEFDGAPRWAVFTDGQPCGDPRPRYYTACAAAAARHFYAGESVSGRRGVDWYADAVVAVARAGRAGGPGYAGTDLLNEPTDPDADPDRAATSAWTGRLHALQRTIVRRLRADGERAPVWIQPQGPRSTGATVDAVLPDLGDEDQVVYAPHAYIDVYDGTPTPATADRMRTQYARFADEARGLRAATVVGEFPGAAGGVWDELRREHLTRQLRSGFGGIAWLWKQPDDGYGWGTLSPDGAVRADTTAAQVLSAARVIAGDREVTAETDGAGGVDVRGGDTGGTVDLWLGTTFGADTEGDANSGYRVTSDQPGQTKIVGAWRTDTSLADTPAAGTVVRLSLPPGRPAVRLAPAG